MFLAPQTTALTTIRHCQFGPRCPAVVKQTAESPQAVPVERPAEKASPAEPAQVKRVTKNKAKDPKRVAAGRAGTAARQK